MCKTLSGGKTCIHLEQCRGGTAMGCGCVVVYEAVLSGSGL